MPGVTTTGFEIPTLPEIKADVEAAFRAVFGPELEMGPDSVAGRIAGVIADREYSLWQRMQEVYNVWNPRGTDGVALENLAALNGVTRKPALAARGTVTLSGTAATIIPAGSLVKDPVKGTLFATTEAATIGGGGTVDVEVEATVTGALEVPAGTVAGPSAVVTVVSGWTNVAQAADFDDGTDEETDEALADRREESLQYSGAGTDGAIRAKVLEIDVVAQAKVISNRTHVTGGDGSPVHPNQPGHSFRVLLRPTAALQDAEVEAIVEKIFLNMPAGIQPWPITFSRLTDPASSGQPVIQVEDASGFSPGDVLFIDRMGVDSESLTVNTVDTVTIPNEIEFTGNLANAHAANAVVIDATGYLAEVTDEDGFVTEVGFSTAAELELYVYADVTTSGAYPVDGNDQLKAAVKALIDGLGMGDDVYRLAVLGRIASIPGVLSVVLGLKFGSAAGAGDNTDLTVGSDEVAVLDTSNINIL